MKKTLSFAIMHFAVAFGVTWGLTGSVVIGGSVALIEPAINTVAYYFHEKLWAKPTTGPAPLAYTGIQPRAESSPA